MRSSLSVDDLRLVLAVHRHRSVGAAARELLTSQPSASQRLALLERRCGHRLFDRDTTGARPTAAGEEFARQAEHVLYHLDEVFDRVGSAAQSRALSVGTFPSYAMLLFPTLEALLGVTVHQVCDHGDQLVSLVAEGSLDACVVAIANQMSLPRGVSASPLGRDRLAVLEPHGAAPAGAGRRPYTGRTVVAYTIDKGSSDLCRRLATLGAEVRPAATAETAVRMARSRVVPVVLPHSLARAYATPAESVKNSPVRADLTLFLVTGRPGPNELIHLLPRLQEELGLSRWHP